MLRSAQQKRRPSPLSPDLQTRQSHPELITVYPCLLTSPPNFSGSSPASSATTIATGSRLTRTNMKPACASLPSPLLPTSLRRYTKSVLIWSPTPGPRAARCFAFTATRASRPTSVHIRLTLPCAFRTAAKTFTLPAFISISSPEGVLPLAACGTRSRRRCSKSAAPWCRVLRNGAPSASY